MAIASILTAAGMSAATASTVSTAVTVATTALGAAAGYQQAQNQKAQTEFQNRQIDENNKAALETMRENYTAANVEEQRVQAEAVQADLNNQKAAAAELGRTNLAAAAMGMGGTSVQDMYLRVQQQKGQNLDAILSGMEADTYRINQMREQAYQSAKAGLQTKLKKPSGWATVASTASGALKGYQLGSSLSDPIKGVASAKGAPVSGSGLKFGTGFGLKASN